MSKNLTSHEEREVVVGCSGRKWYGNFLCFMTSGSVGIPLGQFSSHCIANSQSVKGIKFEDLFITSFLKLQNSLAHIHVSH